MPQNEWVKHSKLEPLQRFFLRVRVDPSSGCFNWTGSTRGRGYGQFYKCRGEIGFAHRFAYTMLKGPIPDGMIIDHLCRNPRCVNPLHLEAVTQAENVRRGLTGIRNKERFLAQTHCKYGHPLSGNNLIPSKVQRVCRICCYARKAARSAAAEQVQKVVTA